ncbi:MAG: HAD family hydrolase [Mogibacterium sp.]|nr:HAD family hydrolase [Mogibacterium sp.]
MNRQYKAAVFDMDGTILDTVEDLRDALNHSLSRFGHRADFTAEDTCAFFGSGALTAVKRALAAESGLAYEDLLRIGTPDEPELPYDLKTAEEILDYYKPYYAEHCAIKTGPYPGITKLLSDLRAAGIKTAVVSNKPDEAVQTLCRDYYEGCFDHAAGEKAGIRRKPAPDMIDAALKDLGIDAKEAVYIGDTEVDIETAANSKLDCICVEWGFRPRRHLEACGAEMIVASCDELAALLL